MERSEAQSDLSEGGVMRDNTLIQCMQHTGDSSGSAYSPLSLQGHSMLSVIFNPLLCMSISISISISLLYTDIHTTA